MEHPLRIISKKVSPNSKIKRLFKRAAYCFGILKHPQINKEYLYKVRKEEHLYQANRLHSLDISVFEINQIFADRPLLFSVIIPIYNPQLWHFKAALSSVENQKFQHWELVLVNCSDNPSINKEIEHRAQANQRIKALALTENGGISRNTNRGLEISSGELIVFLDHDDLLHPYALAEFAAEYLKHHTKLDLIYADEDKISDVGDHRNSPAYKPKWSPHRLLSTNYINHPIAVRSEILKAVNGFRPEVDGSQDHDLLLRLFDYKEDLLVSHIPKVLYHWRQTIGSTSIDLMAKPWAVNSGIKAIEDHLSRSSLRGQCQTILGSYQVKIDSPGSSRICIISLGPDEYNLSAESFPNLEILRFSDVSELLSKRQTTQERVSKLFDYCFFINDSVRPENQNWLEQLSGALLLKSALTVTPKVIDRKRRIDLIGYTKSLSGYLPVNKGLMENGLNDYGHISWIGNLDCPGEKVFGIKTELVSLGIDYFTNPNIINRELLFNIAIKGNKFHIAWPDVAFLTK